MDLYVPPSPRASRKLVAVAFLTFRHHIPFLLLLLLLSKRPSALLKLSKGAVFTPIASTDARGVHRHQAIVTLSLYHSKHIHCLLPGALNDAILFSSHAFARTRSSRYARTVWEIQCREWSRPDRNSHVPSRLLGDYEQSFNWRKQKTLVFASMNNKS